MASNAEAAKKTKNPKSQDAENKGKGALFTILAILTAIVIIAVVFGGFFYFIIHNNFSGLADKYRSSLQKVPLLRLALPAAPDPLDPRYMSADEIKKKYVEFRNENETLRKQLAEYSEKLDEAQKFMSDYDKMKQDADKQMQDVKDRQAALDQKEQELEELKKTLDKITADGNKEAFKTYFESVDPENAKQIYADVVKELQADENNKKFAQIYAAMDAAAAAQIFEQLGNSKIDMIARTLQAMSKENSSAILAAMTPEFAAKVTEKLEAMYKGG